MKKDLTEQKFGLLTVSSKHGIKDHAVLWYCFCDCGKSTVTKTYCLTSGKTKSCGCKKFKNEKNRKQEPTLTSYKGLYNRNKSFAKHRGIEWKIDFQSYVEFVKQNCYYCDIEPNEKYNVYCTKQGKRRPGNIEWIDRGWISFNGLDRIDSILGYFKENIVSCCKWCNFAKNTRSQTEFEEWISRLIKKRKQ